MYDYGFRNLDRQYRRDLASWLREGTWDFLCTFTFPTRPSDDRANFIFKQFVRRIEKSKRCDVSYICCAEKRLSGLGRPPCGRHFHLLMTCGVAVSPDFIEWLWSELAGWPQSDIGARVELYEPTLNGVAYVVKLVDPSFDEWHFRNLHLVHPAVKALPLKSRERRNIRRYEERQRLNSAQ